MADVNTDFNPAFADPVNRLIATAKAKGISTHFISGVRSIDDQRQLYANYLAGKAGKPLPYPARGPVPLAAKPGTSLHEQGFAADIQADDPSQQAALRALGNQLGLRTLGAKDPDHFELPATAIAKAPSYTPGAFAGGGGSSGGAGASGTWGTTVNSPNAPVQGALSASAALDPRQLVFNKLTAAGLQPHQALGALWSLAGESGKGLNPNAYNPNDPGGSVGIGQWMGPRRQALEAFAKARGTAVTDPNTQADFLVDELTNKDAKTYQPGVFASLQGAKTAEDATRVWTGQFERPAKDNSAARIKGGVNVASLDDNGNLSLAGGASAPASTSTAASITPAAQPQQDQGWLSKLINPPTDAQGNPTGAKSPLAELASASMSRLSSEGQTTKDEEPARSALSGQGPGARNVSPMLASVAQTYGQTLNSFDQPLTWTSRPMGATGMPQAGLQPTPATQAPGISLNSLPVLPDERLGYGVNPVGYGYG